MGGLPTQLQETQTRHSLHTIRIHSTIDRSIDPGGLHLKKHMLAPAYTASLLGIHDGLQGSKPLTSGAFIDSFIDSFIHGATTRFFFLCGGAYGRGT